MKSYRLAVPAAAAAAVSSTGRSVRMSPVNRTLNVRGAGIVVVVLVLVVVGDDGGSGVVGTPPVATCWDRATDPHAAMTTAAA